MRTITVSYQKLFVLVAILSVFVGFGHRTWNNERRSYRLNACRAVAEGLRQNALSQWHELDQVTHLVANPSRIPQDSAHLDPSLAGWETLAHTWSNPVYGQFSVDATGTGFRVDVDCLPLPGEGLVHFTGTETEKVRPGTAPEVVALGER